MAAANPAGLELDPADVQSWLDIRWLAMEEYGGASTRRILNWWGRAREDELVQARERRIRIEERAHVQQLEQRQAELNAQAENVVAGDFFARVARK